MLGPDPSRVSRGVFEGPVPACQGAEGTAETPTGPDRMFGSKRFHTRREVTFQGLVSGAGRYQASVKQLQVGPREGFYGSQPAPRTQGRWVSTELLCTRQRGQGLAHPPGMSQ